MPPFEQPEYNSEKFKDLTAEGQIIENVQFRDCAFSNCSFCEATFSQCGFERCTFKHCDLSLVRLPMSFFQDVVFSSCRLMGINWFSADWSKHSLLKVRHVDFEDCLLDHSVFIGLDLKETKFTHCTARHLDFEGADLTGADFSEADLEMTRFSGCNLTETNFVHAQNYQINAAENNLHQARFSLPEAVALLYSLDIIIDE